MTSPPALVAAGCLLAALSGVRSRVAGEGVGNLAFRQVLETLAFVTGHSLEEMLACAARTESLILHKLSASQSQELRDATNRVPSPHELQHFLGLASSIDPTAGTQSHYSKNNNNLSKSASKPGGSTMSTANGAMSRSSSTPTEMMDVATTCVC